MIKSVTIKDRRGKLLLQISCSKKGGPELIALDELNELQIDVRDEANRKIDFGPPEKVKI